MTTARVFISDASYYDYYEFDWDLLKGGIPLFSPEELAEWIGSGRARRVQEASEESDLSDGVLLLMRQRRRLQEAKGGQES